LLQHASSGPDPNGLEVNRPSHQTDVGPLQCDTAQRPSATRAPVQTARDSEAMQSYWNVALSVRLQTRSHRRPTRCGELSRST
jgi:hypothetical protein